jgi:hypothetical protein
MWIQLYYYVNYRRPEEGSIFLLIIFRGRFVMSLGWDCDQKKAQRRGAGKIDTLTTIGHVLAHGKSEIRKEKEWETMTTTKIVGDGFMVDKSIDFLDQVT